MQKSVQVLVALVMGTAVGACFNAPAADVMFACGPDDDAAPCPSGYTCEVDGCCHRDGSDVKAQLGGCQLGGGQGTGTGTGAVTSSAGTGTTAITTTDPTSGGATTDLSSSSSSSGGTDTGTSTGTGTTG